MDDYIRIVHKTTEFFSKTDAYVLFDILEQFAQDGGYDLKMSKEKFKAKMTIPLSETQSVTINASILKVDEEKVCFEFYKTNGDSW